LIDCGVFPCARQASGDEAGDFGLEASEIDWMLLTHAHRDHCDRIPLLIKRGFKGEIICSSCSTLVYRVWQPFRHGLS